MVAIIRVDRSTAADPPGASRAGAARISPERPRRLSRIGFGNLRPLPVMFQVTRNMDFPPGVMVYRAIPGEYCLVVTVLPESCRRNWLGNDENHLRLAMDSSRTSVDLIFSGLTNHARTETVYVPDDSIDNDLWRVHVNTFLVAKHGSPSRWARTNSTHT